MPASSFAVLCLGALCLSALAVAQPVGLPESARVVWDLDAARREVTPTRERVCINGLWRWQPAGLDAREQVPGENWGHFKVPGAWPGITDYMQKDSQTVFAHPGWGEVALGSVAAAWHQREITIPAQWAGRRIVLHAEYLNSLATVFLDGSRIGEIRFPWGQVELTAACQPGAKHLLSVLVEAMPLKGVMLSYSNTNEARSVQGTVRRRGLCGDVTLIAEPAGPRIADIKVDTSVRRSRIRLDAALGDLAPGARYTLQAEVCEQGRPVRQFRSGEFTSDDLRDGRISFGADWLPDKLWDIHTPENMLELRLSLHTGDRLLDQALPQRFGFRELWIDGRDFFLNGTRIFLSAVPFDNAQVGAAAATYDAALETMRRLQSFGINFVYTHNYGCEPGSHLSFSEILRAADDAGMLFAISQPHFGHYEWNAEDADQTNGYARHAEFYVRMSQNHPAVVAYSTSHNATGYSEDMNPDLIDGVHDPRAGLSESALRSPKLALRAESIIQSLDPTRIVYHHSSGNLGSMHTSNFYPNFVPVQEMSDWFEHWSTNGRKPLFLVEYGAPFGWDFALYRGWYKGSRAFGSAVAPWELCLAEWNAQFRGDSAYEITDVEKRCLRWEAQRFRAGPLWHRWDYPHQIGSTDFEEQYPVMGEYTAHNWRAFRTWELSANSPWIYGFYWKLREGVDKARRELPTHWDDLQRPGYSPDFIGYQYERMDLAFQREDWIPKAPAQALYRNNMPLLGYIAGRPGKFTSQDHIFRAGETFHKQLVVINNSRETVRCVCEYSLKLPASISGEREISLATGNQERMPLRFALPADLPPGTYPLAAKFTFSDGQTQEDSFDIHVVPAGDSSPAPGRIALFDPAGQTGGLLAAMGFQCETVGANADLSGYDILVVGKTALNLEGPAPDLSGVPDGLKVVVFEQTAEALEQRLGFRVVAYGLRQVFTRIPDHPVLAGLSFDHLRDWRGEAALLSPRLEYAKGTSDPPKIRWAGISVPQLWRCGNQGTVASVLIEKPSRGDFLPIIDGGFSLQYSPLMEYREGRGMVLFCQLDVTGRTESDPVATDLAGRVIRYAAAWQPTPRREAIFVGDPEGRRHLDHLGIRPGAYQGGNLRADQVLIVGSGGGAELAGKADALGEFMRDGGHVLALGLDETEADALLPFDVTLRKTEHIAACFAPPAMSSPLAGVGPADVHNRDPRELPLVAEGAEVVGNGVLATAAAGRCVFFQLPPHTVTAAWGALPSFTVTAEDAAHGTRSALVALGATTDLGIQFGQTVKPAGEVGNTYTFSALLKALDRPLSARLEIERAGSPWDRALKTAPVLVPTDQWTELHATFTAEKAYPEGWQAYIACSQDGGRFRADALRLYEGEYVPLDQARENANLLTNASFEEKPDKWWFRSTENRNTRRTYRRTAFALARILANMGVSAKTPLLEHFRHPLQERTDDESAPPIIRNGQFQVDANRDGLADDWGVAITGEGGSRSLERAGQDTGGWYQRVSVPGPDGNGRSGVMLSQLDVPVTGGQWYRISLKARAGEGLQGIRATLAIQNTKTWLSFFEYQRFTLEEQWQEFSFLVQANDSAESGTRFQVWHEGSGTVWYSDVRMIPVRSPGAGRWLAGLYVDEPEDWDYPYRFFRW